MSKVFYKVLFWVAFAPAFAFMVVAIVLHDAAFMVVDKFMCDLEDKGWPE